ncbi:MAG TPA: hypothetical protein VI485_29370 [Vicinamibacterales bacterium]|nr:hypothetical protein [Vicinamibacterales bacterium]
MIIARPERLLAAAAILAGLAAWLFYLNEGLVLAHYDAKAHLVVARRVIDSLTPGWRQIGAVWLPLPHLIQLLPTQIDVLYRTGAFGSLVSVGCFGIATWAMARLVLSITGSHVGALASAALFVLNPNLLYVQSTPMTEPLLLALTLLSVLWLHEWISSPATDHVPSKLGWILFAAAWTRYEAWPILGAALAAAAFAMWRRGLPFDVLASRMWRVARWPAAAVGLFLVLSRLTVGSWFVSGGFYEIDPTYAGQPGKALLAIWWGTHRLSGYVIEIVALATAAFVTIRALVERNHASPLVTIALFSAAVLPGLAFFEAHPFRIRYMVPLVSACALFGGLAVGLIGPPKGGPYVGNTRRAWAGWLLALSLIASTLIESPPWAMTAPLIDEAQWDVPNSRERQHVTTCLAPAYRGEKVLASMGSLAHYMQELSHEGFAIADFIHEGNGALWDLALQTGPAPHAGWMLVEEQSEGGDVLAQRVRRDASFTRGMTKTCEGGGVVLYKRD